MLRRIYDFNFTPTPPLAPPPLDAALSRGDSYSAPSSAAPTTSLSAAEAADAAFADAFGPLVFVAPICAALPATLRGNSGGRRGGSGGQDPSAAASFSAARGSGASVSQCLALPLVPGGETMRVTYASRRRYVELTVAAVAAQYSAAAQAMRRGMAAAVPERALRLCSWRDLQRLVCGEDEVDSECMACASGAACSARSVPPQPSTPLRLIIAVEVLRRNTDYDSRKFYSAEHPTIRFFWEALSELSTEQKRGFIRYV